MASWGQKGGGAGGKVTVAGPTGSGLRRGRSRSPTTSLALQGAPSCHGAACQHRSCGSDTQPIAVTFAGQGAKGGAEFGFGATVLAHKTAGEHRETEVPNQEVDWGLL